MSREISADYLLLSQFVEKYHLNRLEKNSDFNKILSQQHKKYFSYLTAIAELVSISTQKKDITPGITDEQIHFLRESCSDMGNALFVMIHGAYKPSKLILRSSIETFLKGFVLDELLDIDEEKSVYNLFKRVNDLAFFKTTPQKTLFNSIHNNYKNLCKIAHTASKANMANVTALKYFPSFSLKHATEISTILQSLASTYLVLLCLKYNDYFHIMHYRNKENILQSIPKMYRPMIQGIK